MPWWRRRRTASCELRLVRGHSAALPRRDDLPGVERQARQQPERAAGRVAVPGAERAGGVFDERDVLRHGGLELLPGDGPAEEVDGEHRAGARRDRLRDALDPEEERLGIDVDEHGARPAELDHVRGRGERVGGHDHLVARPDADREQGQVERRRPRRDRDRVRRAHRAPERLLELGDPGPHRQLPAREHLGDRGELGLSHVGSRKPDRLGNAHVAHAAAPSRARYQATVRSSPSSSSTRASNPSSDRAFSTFGIRSSTSV